MKSRVLIAFCAACIASTHVAAQLYRWVDSQGKVHYSDLPPPATAKDAQRIKVPAKAPEEEKTSYELEQAKKNFPVTLFVTDCGDACAKARALLAQRAIPHAVKNPYQPADAEALKKLTGGSLEVPVLLIGKTILRGFEKTQWHRELDVAGYPRGTLPDATEKPLQAP